MSDWFSNLTQQAFKFADEIAENIVHQANELSDSLMNQAQEAQTQFELEKRKLEYEEGMRLQRSHNYHLLPWETEIESLQILSDSLMESILAISLDERNFTNKSANSDHVAFVFKDFVPIAMRLLQIDTNLARIHAKLSPKMDEELLWFNYYCRIVYLREASGIEGTELRKQADRWNKSDIIFQHLSGIDSFYSPKHDQTNSNQPLVAETKSPKDINLSEKKIITNEDEAGVIGDIEVKSDNQDALIEEELSKLDLNDIDLLDELDVNPDEYEDIHMSDCNDELEAQIALELAEDLGDD